MAISGGDGSIILTTKVDQNGLNNGIKTMKSSVNSLTSSFKKLGTAIGISLGIGALVQFGKQAMQLASDLEEVQNVVDVAFGDMSYKIEKFSKTAIEQFGISQLTAKRTASTYMAMGKGMGIVEDVASDMAITMTGLTADLASFYNMSQERADVILKSVYTGETETLKQLGIVMTEVNLQNFAMTKGITKNLSAMTQQEKTMLRYEYVLEQTALAQGDFARTQDSFANKTRVLSEKWKEMQAIFGETLIILADSFLPVLEWIVEKLTIVALYIAAFARGMRGSNKETQKATDNTKKLGAQSNKTANSIKNTTEAVKNLGKETGETNKQLAQFDDLMVLQTATANDMDIGVIAPNFSEELSALENFLDDETMQNLQDFEKWVSDNKEGIKTALEIAGLGLLGIGIGGVVEKIKKLLGWFKKKDDALGIQTDKTLTESDAVSSLVGAFSLVLAGIPFLLPEFDKLREKLEVLIPNTEALKDGFTEFSDSVGETFANCISWLEESLGLGEGTISNFVNNTFSEISSWATDVSKKIGDTFGEMASAVGIGLTDAWNNVSKFLSDSWNGISSWFSEAWNNVGSWFSETWASVSNWFSEAWNNVGAWFSETWSGVSEWSSQAWSDVGNWFSNAANDVGNFFNEHWDEIVAGIIAGASIGFAIPTGGLSLAGLTALVPFTANAAPALATGGIVPSATMALIGEKGKEAVLPLENNTQWMDVLAEKIISRNSYVGTGRNTEVILEVDGRELGRAIIEQGDKESRRIGTKLVSVTR